LVELPSPFEGVITAIHADEGTTVPVGEPLITISSDATTASEHPRPPATPGAEAAPSTAPEMADDPETEPAPAVLVGYGPSAPAPARRRRRRPAALPTRSASSTQPSNG